jgi:SAM-dependent methyltransferase
VPSSSNSSAPADTPRCLGCGSATITRWCQATDVEYHTTDETFTYNRCADCDVLSIHPVPIDRLGLIYPSNYYSFGAPGTSVVQDIKDRLDARQFADVLAGLRGEQLSVLDIGGGAGWQLDSLRAIDPRITRTTLVDLDGAALDVAKQRGHHGFVGRIEDYETDERFDLVIMLNLIEHVADPASVLRKVRSMLAPGGRVYVKTPEWNALDARIFRHRSWAGLHCPRHWVLFTRESFTRYAEQAGFGVVRSQWTQGAPFWAASVLAALQARGVVRIDRERPVVYHPLFKALAGAFAVFDFARSPFARTSQVVFVLCPA